MNMWDVQLFRWFQLIAGMNPAIDRSIFFFAERLGWFVGLALLLFLIVPCVAHSMRHRARLHAELFFFAVSSALIARFGIKTILSALYPRPRPFEAIEGVRQIVFLDGGASFPSGHATFFFAIATAIALYYPRISIPFFVSAFLISLARIIGGAHWPTDIIAGALIGIAVPYALHIFFLRRKQ